VELVGILAGLVELVALVVILADLLQPTGPHWPRNEKPAPV
jgi:hypothetical protein